MTTGSLNWVVTQAFVKYIILASITSLSFNFIAYKWTQLEYWAIRDILGFISVLWCWRRLLIVPWTTRRSNQSILKDISPEYSLKGLMLKQVPILWPPHAKNWLTGKDSDAGKDWGQEKGMTEDEMVGWHHWFNVQFEQTLGVGDGLESLACCSPWGRKQLDTTERLDWTEQCTNSLHLVGLLLLLSHFSRSVVSNSLPPHEPQHARPTCPSPTPGVHPNPCPSTRWWHPTILSSVIPFSCPQSFKTSGSFQMSQLFAPGSQSIGVSASASVLPMNTQDWSPLGWTGWVSLQSKGLSRVFSNTTVQKHQFFGA